MSNMSSHVKRWITGIIAVPLLIVAILYSSPLIFSLIITLLIAAGVFEYNSMIFKGNTCGKRPKGWYWLF